MKPFLLLAIRPEDVAADDEYAAILRCTGLDEHQLRRVRMEQGPIGRVDLDQWSGIILGGGPFQASDPEDSKSAVQRRVEAELAAGNAIVEISSGLRVTTPSSAPATGSAHSADIKARWSTAPTASRSAASRSP